MPELLLLMMRFRGKWTALCGETDRHPPSTLCRSLTTETGNAGLGWQSWHLGSAARTDSWAQDTLPLTKNLPCTPNSKAQDTPCFTRKPPGGARPAGRSARTLGVRASSATRRAPRAPGLRGLSGGPPSPRPRAGPPRRDACRPRATRASGGHACRRPRPALARRTPPAATGPPPGLRPRGASGCLFLVTLGLGRSVQRGSLCLSTPDPSFSSPGRHRAAP